MKLQMEIDIETVDKIVKNDLAWHLQAVREDIKKLNKIKNPTKGQIEDQKYFTKLLPALETVGDYYGVK